MSATLLHKDNKAEEGQVIHAAVNGLADWLTQNSTDNRGIDSMVRGKRGGSGSCVERQSEGSAQSSSSCPETHLVLNPQIWFSGAGTDQEQKNIVT